MGYRLPKPPLTLVGEGGQEVIEVTALGDKNRRFLNPKTGDVSVGGPVDPHQLMGIQDPGPEKIMVQCEYCGSWGSPREKCGSCGASMPGLFRGPIKKPDPPAAGEATK